MSTTALGSATSTAASTLEPVVKKIVDRIDGNKDGQITTAEFGDFLTSLLQAHTAAPPTAAGKGTPGFSADAAARSAFGIPTGTLDPAEPAGEFHPSTWTDNNCMNGITFAGWSPQDHTDLSLEDLGIPGKAEKYAVYHHLVTTGVQPTKDWAPAAAAALNAKYNTDVYKVIDGETLGFGNEYVHSAPNGYGMLPGTYNPSASGEFFWGWI
jgi:hypothetical protein